MNTLKNLLRKGITIGSFCLVSGTILSAQISLSMQNKSTREVIREIEKVSDYRFFYNDNLSGLNTKISVSAQGENIRNLLEQIKQQAQITYIIKENNQSNEKKYYYVDIKGEVKDPGVYKLKEGSRVIDAINASGGLKENANTYSVNLSKKITDEMVIIVPSNSENTNVSDNTITQNTKNSGLVNINTATTKELLSITGIGESKASNIVKYREENGNFSSIEDIKNVSGIGDSLFEKIKKYITV